jgi:hypothetical protein
MSERRLEAVVIGPGKPGILKVVIGRGRGEFVADVPFEKLEPSLRLPNSHFVAVVEGRELVRVEPAGRIWLTIQDEIRSVLNTDWDPIGVVGRVARALSDFELRVPHLSRRMTGGVFDFLSFIDN